MPSSQPVTASPGQKGRGAPDAGVEIAFSEALDTRGAGKGREGELLQQGREQQEDHANRGAEHQRAHQDGAHLFGFAPAIGLCGEAGGRHAKKTEAPIDETVGDRGDGHRGKVFLAAEPAHDGGVHNPGRGNGRLRQNDWYGERDDFGPGQHHAGLAEMPIGEKGLLPLPTRHHHLENIVHGVAVAICVEQSAEHAKRASLRGGLLFLAPAEKTTQQITQTG